MLKLQDCPLHGEEKSQMVLGWGKITAGLGAPACPVGRTTVSGLSTLVYFMSCGFQRALKPSSRVLQVMAARRKLITCFKSSTPELPSSCRDSNEVLQAEGVAWRLLSPPQHRASCGQAISPGLEAAQDPTDPPPQRRKTSVAIGNGNTRQLLCWLMFK